MHYLPHDGDNISAMAYGDEAQSLYGFMVNVLRLHARPVEKPKRKNVSIQYARTLLGRCAIAEDNCASFIDDLMDYEKTWDEKSGDFKEAPGNHYASHSVDALQTLSIAYLSKHIPIKYSEPISYLVKPRG